MREDDLWRSWMNLSVYQSSMYQRRGTVVTTILNNAGGGWLGGQSIRNKKGLLIQAFVKATKTVSGRFSLPEPQALYQAAPRWQISAMSHRAQRRPCRPD